MNSPQPTTAEYSPRPCYNVEYVLQFMHMHICNNCNENEDNSSIWNKDSLQIPSGPDPIIIMKTATVRLRPCGSYGFGETEKIRMEKWEGCKKVIWIIDIIVKYIQSQLEKRLPKDLLEGYWLTMPLHSLGICFHCRCTSA